MKTPCARWLLAVLSVSALSVPALALAQQPYVGEIRWVAFNFAPQGWASCDGQLLLISENEALFNLYGTTYGGDGVSSFALPDVRGRGMIHDGSGPGLSPRYIGEQGGVETVTLGASQMPVHGHTAYAANGLATKPTASDSYLARLSTDSAGTPLASGVRMFRPSGLPVALNSGMIGNAGGGQPHENLPPFTTLNCIVSLFGIYPSRQ